MSRVSLQFSYSTINCCIARNCQVLSQTRTQSLSSRSQKFKVASKSVLWKQNCSSWLFCPFSRQMALKQWRSRVERFFESFSDVELYFPVSPLIFFVLHWRKTAEGVKKDANQGISRYLSIHFDSRGKRVYDKISGKMTNLGSIRVSYETITNSCHSLKQMQRLAWWM